MKDNIAIRANAVLEYCADCDIHLTPLHLQKLIYLDYGRYLADGGLFIPSLDFEAWPLGPVIPEVYHYYKKVGSDWITFKVSSSDGKFYTLMNSDKERTDNTIRFFGKLPASALVDLTHKYNGAWSKAFKQNKGTLIDHKEIKKTACMAVL